jgi:hypothetical protein
MEIIYIGLGIFWVWLVRTLLESQGTSFSELIFKTPHKITRREQEEKDKNIAFAKWAKEQHHPHIVSIIQNFMSEGRFKTWEEAAIYADGALNTPSSPPRLNSHTNDTKGTPA